MDRISMVFDPDVARFRSRVEIETNSGMLHTKYTDVTEETPEIMIKRKRISEKYFELCSPLLGYTKAAESLQCIDSLEKVDNIRKFVEKTV
jgi:hypothetical protein